jgi:signal transduction histidine kinase
MGVEDNQTDLPERIRQLETEVKLRTEQLIASTSRAYSFLDSLQMGFIMTDVHGEIVVTNETVRQLIPSPEELKPQILKCLESRQPAEIKEMNVGQRLLRLSLAPMLAENGQEKQLLGAVILVEDITEQAVLERSKDEFLSIASHELRTPLTAIRGNTSMIKKYYADQLADTDLNEMVDDIHESSVRLIAIVNDFLDVSALEQGKMRMNPETFHLQEIIEGAVHELKSLCDAKGIALIADPRVVEAPPVNADKQRIKQVVINLVGNAIKFTDQGGITVGARSDDNFVYVTVADTGRGMPPESQRLLFRKFQQAGEKLLTRDTTKGTGLGLYISKLIVEQSGGRIGLESSVAGKGSVFAFSLPRTH